MDIGVSGYIGIVQHKEHHPEVFHIPPGTPCIYIYIVSQEERAKLRDGVPYVELYRYNPKHLYPKFDGYGDIEHRKVRTRLVSAYSTLSVTSYSSYPQLHSYVIARCSSLRPWLGSDARSV